MVVRLASSGENTAEHTALLPAHAGMTLYGYNGRRVAGQQQRVLRLAELAFICQ
jgi:hypothetical protein